MVLTAVFFGEYFYHFLHYLDKSLIFIEHSIYYGPGNSVGIATGYGLEGPGIESQ
jgi:hypothetical protein